jgi:hypothetical protein
MLVNYITSFSHKLYETTGKRLVGSYAKWQINLAKDASLLYQYSEEDGLGRRINPEYLNWYLTTFKHLIPPNLGGTAGGCICATRSKGITAGKINHQPGCHNTLWNRNAYRWFHKVAALKTYIDGLNSSNTPDYLVWLDCDCFFKQTLPNQFIADLCADYDICYLKGTKREAIESGILIFSMDHYKNKWGSDIIQSWFNWYRLKWFLTLPRWDDGYVLTKVIKDGAYEDKDLVARKATSRPADDCPLTPYIGHDKGTHVRDHQLF